METQNKAGQIQVFAKNIKGKANCQILEESKKIKNTAIGKLLQTGKKEGVKNDINQKRKSSVELKVLKVEGPFDKDHKKVDVIEKNKWYTYKVTKFNRDPTKNELQNLHWGIKYDDGSMRELANVSCKGFKEITHKVLENNNTSKLRMYAFFKVPDENASVEVFKNHVELIITDEIIGYTIMRIFDVADDFKTTMLKDKFPACIASVYKVTIKYYEENKVYDYGSFGLTRDGWQKIDELKNKYFMINRAFEPKDSQKNIYKAVHSFVPFQYKGLMKIDAFELKTLDGKSNIPAEPIYTNYKLDKKTFITHKREKIDEATNVNIHIGGHYTRGRTMNTPIEIQYSSPTTGAPIGTSYEISEIGVHWLGGSLGCFAFVESADIKLDINSAIDAHNKNLYRKNTSNREWQNIVNKIHELEKDKKTNIIVKLIKRNNYKKVISDFDPKNILWE